MNRPGRAGLAQGQVWDTLEGRRTEGEAAEPAGQELASVLWGREDLGRRDMPGNSQKGKVSVPRTERGSESKVEGQCVLNQDDRREDRQKVGRGKSGFVGEQRPPVEGSVGAGGAGELG